jgi:hypothetical protein
MPDLDEELAGLRDTLRERVTPPELRAVVDRYRQRTSRRRRQLGAVAAVLLVGATIPLVRTALRPVDDPAAARPVSSFTPAVDPSVRSALPEPFLHSVWFVDGRHGYALRAGCGPENNADCFSELLVTEDGEHWVTRKLPPAIGHSIGGVTGQLYVFGRRTLLAGDLHLRGAPRFYSSDAGETWQQLRSTDDEVIDTIPEGAHLEFTCTGAEDCMAKLLVVRPDSGKTASLRTPPPLTNVVSAASIPVDGAWWVSGDDAAGRRVLAVSRDAGASWSLADLPGLLAQPFWISVSSAGPVLYATVTGQLPEVKNGLVSIYRSSDHGQHWEPTWQSGTGREPRSTSGIAVAATDGTLTIHTELGQTYLSRDGGRTFDHVESAPGVGQVTLTPAGYLAGPPDPSSTSYRLSPDGVHWREITVG